MRNRRRDEETRAGLRHLAPALDALPARHPSTELVDRTLRAARAELAQPVSEPVRATLPAGFGREFARLLGLSAAPGALALAWNALVLVLAPPILAQWVPAPIASAFVGLYVFAALGWFALVYGSLPFVAHRRALKRHREVPS